LTKAAEQGHAAAQYNLGVFYYNGQGVAKDQTTAVQWITNAAEQGHADAQAALKQLGK
jgi:TPR repeat protein